eukprot:Gb_41185 [translate_table: standard]
MISISHSSLFAFSEILLVPSILELQGTEFSKFLDLLHLFSHGTWNDYKSIISHFPLLESNQVCKLKQLTVLIRKNNKGKLDQCRCFEVQFIAGRDLRTR